MQVKKFLCLFLAFLMLAATFAVAEDETANIPPEKLLKLEAYVTYGNNGQQVYEISGKCDPNRTLTLSMEKSMTVRGGFWPVELKVREQSDLTADANGVWKLRLPVRNSQGNDYLADFGNQKIVYLWGKYSDEGDETYSFIFALQRSDELPDAGHQQEPDEENKYLVLEPEFGWKATTMTVMIQLRNDDKPFAGEDVTLCKKNDSRRAVAGKTDAEGIVTFELSQAMMEPGTVLTLVYSKNQELIKEFTVPAAPTPIVMETVVTAAPDAQPTMPSAQRVETVVVPAPADNSDGILLKGLPLPLVIVLCAVFLISYGVCWFLIKNPQKSRGKGV